MRSLDPRVRLYHIVVINQQGNAHWQRKAREWTTTPEASMRSLDTRVRLYHIVATCRLESTNRGMSHWQRRAREQSATPEAWLPRLVC